MKRETDTYEDSVAIEVGGARVRLAHPSVTAAERERRLEKLKRTAAAVLRAKRDGINANA